MTDATARIIELARTADELTSATIELLAAPQLRPVMGYAFEQWELRYNPRLSADDIRAALETLTAKQVAEFARGAAQLLRELNA